MITYMETEEHMITIRKETEAKLRAYAKKRGITPPEAVDKVTDGAFSRWGALAKYAQKIKAKGKRAKRAPKKEGAKKEAKKGATKKAALKKAA